MQYILHARSWLLLFFLALITGYSCQRSDEGSGQACRFTMLFSEDTGIDFVNQVDYTEEYNTYTYRNFYNGAGVGLGDFNNDGLTDLYFCGNIVDNKLYLNKGDFHFEDISEQAGVACPGVWSTGVSIADVNGDGWLDIYVCKSGDPSTANRSNELFINNGDLTFAERAVEYGIADLGLSTHASFFDYDRDGDLDLYLLNNSFQSVTQFDAVPGQREHRDPMGGNKLYRNDGTKFLDISEDAGIYGSKIGFGLGVSVADVNRDGWLDLYVSNDFFERDYLYINQKDGTFRESLEEEVMETSMGAMGADVADVNNDCYPEIFVTEMTAEGNSRLKTKVVFESWDSYQTKLINGYHHQFARNVLQLNNKNESFSEIGRLAGVEATDWSWGALILDMDNDGWKDIFVANGIYKDLLDRDYIQLYSDPAVMRSMIQSEEQAIISMIDQIPSEKIPNYAFHNNGNLTFTNLAEQWGLDTPSFSNGAAYGDLDNDGDLDLVVNNVNMPSFVYRNETVGKTGSNFLSVKLRGKAGNPFAIGASVTLYLDGKKNYQELIPMRGFKSSMDYSLHFGLGGAAGIDSLVVQWPDGCCFTMYELEANQVLTLGYNESSACPSENTLISSRPVFEIIADSHIIEFTHRENEFSDFDRDPLLFQMISNEGPHIAVADVNNDGLEDLFVGGAKDSPGGLFLQDNLGHFLSSNSDLFRKDRISEDTDCVFFDADGDQDQDLYVCSGSNEFPASSSALVDRLYFNDGTGNFEKSAQMLPVSGYKSSSCVKPADFDGDGDLDLFVGSRLRPFLYGVPVDGFLLENDGKGVFKDVSATLAENLHEIGLITDMAWADVDTDGDPDMIIVGQWMPVRILINENGTFSDQSENFGLSDTEGWWNRVFPCDVNGDKHLDLILGNHGLNSRFKASVEQPAFLYVNDFDMNGSVEHILCTFNGERSYPMVMKDVLVDQIPPLADKYPLFKDYQDQGIEDIFSEEVINRSLVLKTSMLENCVFMNSGMGSFEKVDLPVEAQFSPVYALAAEDFNGDGHMDLLIGGNQYRAKPESGIFGAGFGQMLTWTAENKWSSVPSQESGIHISGQIRDLKRMTINGSKVIVVARNNDKFEFLRY